MCQISHIAALLFWCEVYNPLVKWYADIVWMCKLFNKWVFHLKNDYVIRDTIDQGCRCQHGLRMALALACWSAYASICEGIKRTTTTSRLIRSRNVGGGLVKCVTYVTYVTYRRLIKSVFEISDQHGQNRCTCWRCWSAHASICQHRADQQTASLNWHQCQSSTVCLETIDGETLLFLLLRRIQTCGLNFLGKH